MTPSSESASQVLQQVLTSQELPTLPLIASKLLVLTAKEETTLTDIANLVTQDMALSSKMLRVANSSFYSFPQQISSINQAVSILGINAVRSLVLTFSFLSLNKKTKNSLFQFEQFWERSLVEATAAKLIIEQVATVDTDEVFTCALLQNIGKLILATTLPKQYDQFLERMGTKAPDVDTEEPDELALESELIGVEHTHVGYEVAKAWGLPENVLLSIRHHHVPEAYQVSNQRIKQTINACYLGNLLAQIFYSDTPELYHKLFRSEARRLLGLKVLDINTVLKMIDKVIDQSAQFFGIKVNPFRSVAEILQEANLRLSLLNLSYEEMNRELIKSKIELEKLTEELAQKNKLLENLANIDGLTEIHNHRYFQQFLDSEINRAIRKDRVVSLLLADIDHFKRFNDTYGHQTGDFILKEFCRVSKEIIREYDLIARYGGEEFAFVLPETAKEEALAVAEKIRSNTDDFVFDDGVNTYRVTISIGVVSARPSATEFKKDDFIKCADEALYEAKKAGRNRVSLASQAKKKKWFAF